MQRDNILEELQFSGSGCTDESCQLEIGKMLQANKMIVGSMGAVGNLQILNVKLVDVETGETLKSASKEYANMDEMLLGSTQLVNELLGLQPEDATPIEVAVPKDKSETQTDPGAVSDTKAGYSGSLPFLDLAIPGFSHFQAGNTLMGIVYLTSAVGGGALLGFSEYKYNSDVKKYQTTRKPELKKDAALWRTMSIVGGGVLGVSIITSVVHGFIAKANEED